MNVLVIPEDFRKDQFILQPIIAAMFTKLGHPAIVEVLRDPLIGGIERALNQELLWEVVDSNRWKVDLFLLCVDRDGEEGRRSAMDGLETGLNRRLGTPKVMVAENAWQELEVWALAGLDLPEGWTWSEIQQERDPKEKYFDRLVKDRRLQDDAGGGRKTLGMAAAKRYRTVRSRCREDIQVLEKRIDQWIRDGVLLSWAEAFRGL